MRAAMRLSPALFSLSLVLATGNVVLGQGALTPPGGMIVPIMKTLDQVEPRIPIPGGAVPFTISIPGSYYLTGNRTAKIQVTVDLVTIDLNGFAVEIPLGPGSAVELPSRNHVVVRNGRVSRIFGGASASCTVEDVFSKWGIYFTGASSTTVRRCTIGGGFSIETGANSVVEDCVVEGGGEGIRVGSHSMVRRCRVTDAGTGMIVGARSIVTECIISGATFSGVIPYALDAGAEGVSISKTQVLRNGAGLPFVGIRLGPYGSASECVIVGNTASGIEVTGGKSASITHCVISENGGNGIIGSSEMLVANSRITNNSEDGIIAGNNVLIQNCVVFANGGNGIEVGDGSSIVDSVSAGHSTGSGFLLGGLSRTSIRNCVARGNSIGINALNDTLISHCTAIDNLLQGIRVQSNCQVLQNHMTGNGDGTADAAGLLVVGSINRIEGNNMGYNSARGLKVSGTKNFIVRNTVGSDGATLTHYDIAAGNRVAPIVAATANGAAISGGSAATSLGSTDPAANYSY